MKRAGRESVDESGLGKRQMEGGNGYEDESGKGHKDEGGDFMVLRMLN